MLEKVDNLRNQFLDGMSQVANTVSVLTTDGSAGKDGVTISAMSSVSADSENPTLLVCVHQDCAITPKVESNGVFCVNILRDDQVNIAETFAGRKKAIITDKFACTKWNKMMTGSPSVKGSVVSFDCKMLSAKLVGTHNVIIGEVVEIVMSENSNPLVHLNRSYATFKQIKN